MLLASVMSMVHALYSPITRDYVMYPSVDDIEQLKQWEEIRISDGSEYYEYTIRPQNANVQVKANRRHIRTNLRIDRYASVPTEVLTENSRTCACLQQISKSVKEVEVLYMTGSRFSRERRGGMKRE